MNFSQGHSGTKVQCESCLFSQGRTPEFTKKGEIHELFVLALSLVWFAGATPEKSFSLRKRNRRLQRFWLADSIFPQFGEMGGILSTVSVRKILVSVRFLSAILGPEMAAPILWTPGKMRPFCRKNHVHKIPRFRGGYFGFWGEGGVPILFFMGARIFLIRELFQFCTKFGDCSAKNSVSLLWRTKESSLPRARRGPKNSLSSVAQGVRKRGRATLICSISSRLSAFAHVCLRFGSYCREPEICVCVRLFAFVAFANTPPLLHPRFSTLSNPDVNVKMFQSKGTKSTRSSHFEFIQRRKSIYYHNRKKIFQRTFLASKKNFPGRR